MYYDSLIVSFCNMHLGFPKNCKLYILLQTLLSYFKTNINTTIELRFKKTQYKYQVRRRWGKYNDDKAIRVQMMRSYEL